jgi:protein TonB
MSELLIVEGAISAGSGELAGAAVRRPTTAARSGAGLNLPMAGAVFLHLALLALALLAPRLGGQQDQPPEVYPVQLYNAAEVLASAPGERSDPVAPPLRGLPAPPARAEVRTAAFPPPTPVRETAPTVAGPVSAGMAPLSVAPAPVSPAVDSAPAQSGNNGGAAAASGAKMSSPAGSGEVVAAISSTPTGTAGAVTTAPAALPEVLAQPLYRENPEPEYPTLARRRQLEGTVVLEVLVTSEGTVGGLALHQSSGYSLLDEAALKGVKGWRFVPGRRGAAAVAMPVLVPVRFGLR